VNHIVWFASEWAQRRRNQTKFAGEQFGKWIERRYDGGSNLAELWERYCDEIWNVHLGED
jgi:hypothetical protein